LISFLPSATLAAMVPVIKILVIMPTIAVVAPIGISLIKSPPVLGMLLIKYSPHHTSYGLHNKYEISIMGLIYRSHKLWSMPLLNNL
jgi:hypothetical protein